MKKVSLLSLVAALIATTGASAGTENPLYAPAAGKAYSITEYRSFDGDDWWAKETIGYGISDRWQVYGAFDYMNQDQGDDGMDFINLNASYKYLNSSLTGYIYGGYETYLDKDIAGKYDAYTVGTSIGKVAPKYTVAGHAEYTLVSPDVGDDLNTFKVGVDGLYQFASQFSGLLGFEYEEFDQSGIDNPVWAKVDLNYNVTSNSVATLFYKTDIAEDEKDEYGVRYGIQF
jgi:hypothetical protein